MEKEKEEKEIISICGSGFRSSKETKMSDNGNIICKSCQKVYEIIMNYIV